MNNQVSERLQKMSTSATLAMAAKARSLKNDGVDVIGLSLGEPDFDIPDFIKEAYDVAVKEKYNFYSYGDAMLIL